MRVVVIGGGLSGLATAHAVIREANREEVAALRLTLLEASARLGGNIYTERSDGFVIDAGPDAFVVTRPQASSPLRRSSASGRDSSRPSPKIVGVYVLRRGKLIPMPEGLVLGIPSRIRSPFCASPSFFMSGKLRALREVVERTVDAGGDISVGEFLERRFGREMVRRRARAASRRYLRGRRLPTQLALDVPDWFKETGARREACSGLRAPSKRRRQQRARRVPRFDRSASGMRRAHRRAGAKHRQRRGCASNRRPRPS